MEKLPKYFAIKRQGDNPLWMKYINWLNKRYDENYLGELDAYYGRREVFNSDTFVVEEVSQNVMVIALEQWDELLCVKFKNTMMKQLEKEVIGYKFIKPEYKKAVECICGITNFKSFEDYKLSSPLEILNSWERRISLLKEAGVLEQWFEPVYKSKIFQVGDFQITVENGRAFHKEDDITDFVIQMVNHYGYYKSFKNYMCFTEEVIFSKTGCEKTPSKLSEWVAVYNSLK